MKHDITFISTYGLTRPGFLPLSLLSLASSLNRFGYTSGILDYQLVDKDFDLFPAGFIGLLEDSSEIIGISALCGTLPLAVLAAQAIKEKWPAKLIIMGGPGPSPSAEELLKSYPFIDIIVRGEGEETIVKLMDSLCRKQGRDLTDVSGISFRQGKKIIRNPPRPRITNTDNLQPDYHLIDTKKYNLFSILTSRGCPYKCSFCASGPFWGDMVTERSIPGILDEVELLVKEHDVRDFGILDDTFTASPQRVLEFCRGLKKRGIKTSWNCTSRTDLVKEDLFKEMFQAGCYKVVLGAESAVPEILAKIKKETTPDQTVQAVQVALRCNIVPVISFIWGWPFEDLHSFYRSMLFADYLGNMDPRININLNLLSPYRPSEIIDIFGNSLLPAFDDVIDITALKKCVPQKPGSRVLFSDLVKKNPGLFLAFSRYETPDFKRKSAFITRFGDKLGQGLSHELMVKNN